MVAWRQAQLAGRMQNDLLQHGAADEHAHRSNQAARVKWTRGGARTFCGGGRLRSPEQEQWLHRAWMRAPAPVAGDGEAWRLQNWRAEDPTTRPSACGLWEAHIRTPTLTSE